MKHWFFAMLAAICLTSCEETKVTSDDLQEEAQERILQEGTKQVGMPAIKNFRERKLLKDILELRDQANLPTFTYIQAMTGKLIFFCNSVGYGIPYATQFTNPQKIVKRVTRNGGHIAYEVIFQADPSGLFSPASAEGTWILCKDPNGNDVKPIYVEPRVVVSPFKFSIEKE